VANRAEGTVSVLTIQVKTVAPSSVVQPAFTRDGRAALVTRDGDSFISILTRPTEARPASAPSAARRRGRGPDPV